MHLQGWFSPCNGHETWSQRIISKICPTKNPKVNSIDCPLIGLKKNLLLQVLIPPNIYRVVLNKISHLQVKMIAIIS